MKIIDRFEDVAAIKIANMTEEEYCDIVDNFVRKHEIMYYDLEGENTIICDRLEQEDYKKLYKFLKNYKKVIWN